MKQSYQKYIEEFIRKRMDEKDLFDQESSKNILEEDSIRVACILDKFSYECFKYEARFIQLGINNWKQLMISTKPHILFVESAWEGHNKEWTNKVSDLQLSKSNTLLSIIKYCNVNNIPTVFWAKEDPYDFNIFIEAAKHFDYIFTTDSSSIIKYKEILNHDNVFLLPFAAQPKIHNPINKDRIKIGKVAFAGGWYAKFPERCKDIEKMLKPAFKYDLAIYDRFKDRNSKKNSFPPEYNPYIKGSLGYEDIILEYKKYDLLLNVNSTSISTTTFSRRVFELLASGIPTLSSYSKGIEEYFKDIVLLSKTKEDTEKHLNLLLNNKDVRDRISTLGQREVFNHHTYAHRFDQILDKVGLKVSEEEGVSVITCTNRPFSLETILENYLSQSYPVKELIIIINNDLINLEKWESMVSEHDDIKIYKLPQRNSLGKCMNFAVGKSKYNYISKFDDDDYYGPEYLVDSIHAFSYTDASVVGKNTLYAYLERSQMLVLRYPDQEHKYSNYVAGSTLTIKKEVFNHISFRDLSRGEDTKFIIDCLAIGLKIYATDRFNHVVFRRPDVNTHSWKISEGDFMRNCIVVKKTKDFKVIVTV